MLSKGGNPSILRLILSGAGGGPGLDIGSIMTAVAVDVNARRIHHHPHPHPHPHPLMEPMQVSTALGHWHGYAVSVASTSSLPTLATKKEGQEDINLS